MHAYLIDCVIFLLFFSGIRWHLPGRNYASVVMFGLFFKVADRYYQKVTIVVAFGLLSAVVTVVTISSWHSYKDLVLNPFP